MWHIYCATWLPCNQCWRSSIPVWMKGTITKVAGVKAPTAGRLVVVQRSLAHRLSASFMFYVGKYSARTINALHFLKKADLAAIQSYPLHRICMRWELTSGLNNDCVWNDPADSMQMSHQLMLPSRCNYTDKVKPPADVTFKMRLYRKVKPPADVTYTFKMWLYRRGQVTWLSLSRVKSLRCSSSHPPVTPGRLTELDID